MVINFVDQQKYRQIAKKLILLGLLCIVIAPPSAYSQQCESVFEEIMVLREPQFGKSTIWNARYGEDGMEQISDLFAVDNEHVIVAGAYTKDEEDDTYHPFLAKLDHRGRTQWETREQTKDHKDIQQIIKTNSGIAVLGDIQDPRKGNGIYIAHYTKEGKRKTQRMLFEPGGDLDATAFVQSSDGRGFIITASFTHKSDDNKKFGVLYKLDQGNKLLWRRAYAPGGKTAFHGIEGLIDGNYMLTGQFEAEDGRMAGWAVKVDNNGAFQWQRSYARGQEATLVSAAPYQDGNFLLTGYVRPSGGGRPSAWVMKVDLVGNPLWQRYYVGEYRYKAHDAIIYEDNRAVVLVDGNPLDYTKKAHVRLLTLSPRGYLMNAEDYVDGVNAHAMKLTIGNSNEHIISGYTQIKLPQHDDLSDVPDYLFDGWMIAAVPLDPYKDPCLPKAMMMP